MTPLDRHSHDLVAAFNEARLAAVHIDLQNLFYVENGTDIAFPVVADVAQCMRDLGVPNYWVALTHRWHAGSYASFKELYENTHLGLHGCVKPHPDEMVFEKTGQDLFSWQSIAALETLLDAGIDTLVMTGVYHDKCFTDTVRGALNEGFRVYAVADATDCPMGDFDFMPRNILKSVQPSLHHRMTLTSTPLLKQSLAQSAASGEKMSPVLA